VNAARRQHAPAAAALRAESDAAAHAAAMRAIADAPRPLALTAGEAGQPLSGVLSGRFVARNALFYSPSGLALSQAEAEAQLRGPPRAVNARATRFAGAATGAEAEAEQEGAAGGGAGGGSLSGGAGPAGTRGCVRAAALSAAAHRSSF
jgi:hypothetical protein